MAGLELEPQLEGANEADFTRALAGSWSRRLRSRAWAGSWSWLRTRAWDHAGLSWRTWREQLGWQLAVRGLGLLDWHVHGLSPAMTMPAEERREKGKGRKKKKRTGK